MIALNVLKIAIINWLMVETEMKISHFHVSCFILIKKPYYQLFVMLLELTKQIYTNVLKITFFDLLQQSVYVNGLAAHSTKSVRFLK